MEGKLIKTSKDSYHNGHYFLNDDNGFAIGSSDKDWCKRAVKKRPLYVLSLTNCQAIERGFDLDALAEKKYPFDKGYGVYERNCQISDLQDAFLEGFQMRDKMLGDKKFSEEDMLSFESFVSKWYDKATDVEEFRALPSELLIKWESLQQKEWDVTFNPEEKDPEGRLILKRK